MKNTIDNCNTKDGLEQGFDGETDKGITSIIPGVENKCLSKGSGGHGTIYSYNNGKYCAKQVSNNVFEDKEILFYHNNCYIKNSRICRYLPEYQGICNKENKNYVLIQNLKNGMEEPIEMDIKIGKETASFKILEKENNSILGSLFKRVRHKIIDSLMSISSKYYFRVEGLSGFNGSKNKLMKLCPFEAFKIYFSHDTNDLALKQMYKDLNKILKFVNSKKFNYYMMGSSIYFAYDKSDPTKNIVKLIDFAHSGSVDELNKKFKTKIQKYQGGISNLFKMIKFYKEFHNKIDVALLCNKKIRKTIKKTKLKKSKTKKTKKTQKKLIK